MALPAFIRKAVMSSLVMVVAALFAFPAAAARAEERGPGSGPCAEDFAKFCKDVQRGGGRFLQCLKEHENELSSACRQHVAEVKEKAKESKEACQDDVRKFCKDVQPGGGRIMKCLKEHENELSPDCKSNMATRGRRR